MLIVSCGLVRRFVWLCVSLRLVGCLVGLVFGGVLVVIAWLLVGWLVGWLVGLLVGWLLPHCVMRFDLARLFVCVR